jgi:hypothetical protein
MLLEVSVAWQVTSVTPFGKTLPELGAHEGVAPEQLSLTVGVKLTTAVHRFGSVFWVMGFGQVIVGSSLSLIVTVNVQLGPAVVEHVTVVTPFGKLAPDAGLQVTVPHVPVVVGAAKVSVLAQVPGAVLSVMLLGQVIVQGITDTVNVQLFVLPLVSVAVQVTVVVPTAKQVPDAGEQFMVGLGQLSLGVGFV